MFDGLMLHKLLAVLIAKINAQRKRNSKCERDADDGQDEEPREHVIADERRRGGQMERVMRRGLGGSFKLVRSQVVMSSACKRRVHREIGRGRGRGGGQRRDRTIAFARRARQRAVTSARRQRFLTRWNRFGQIGRNRRHGNECGMRNYWLSVCKRMLPSRSWSSSVSGRSAVAICSCKCWVG